MDDTANGRYGQVEIAGIVGHEEIVQPLEGGALLQDDSSVSNPTTELLAGTGSESGNTNALIVSGPEDSSTSLMLLSSFMPTYDFDQQSATLPEIDTSSENVFPNHQNYSVVTNTGPLTITGPSTFACVHCKKKFSSNKAKSQHERLVHCKNGGHVCRTCDRSFANGQYLRDHMKIHSNIKPFVCRYEGCGKSFRLGKDLKRHERVHTGEKPFR